MKSPCSLFRAKQKKSPIKLNCLKKKQIKKTRISRIFNEISFDFRTKDLKFNSFFF